MEGIFGILGFNGQVEQQRLHGMAQTLGGKPETHYHNDNQFSVGMKRLPLISKIQSTAPFMMADGSLCIAINGEINNFHELRRVMEQRGYQYKSDSDAELVGSLYLEKGDDFLRELNGLFTIVIWDSRTQEVILAQDRYAGIRQLYYSKLSDCFIFASSIKPILGSGYLSPEVDTDSLMEFFSIGRVLPPRCIFKGIKKLVPGYLLKCRQDELSLRRVYGFSFSPGIEKRDIHQLDDLFGRSMERNLEADKPPAFLLSGGLDSSLNVAMASRLYDQPLTTISVGFSDEALDESAYAHLVSEHFNTVHHTHTLDSSDALEILPRLAWSQEEPISDGSAVPSFHLADFSKNLADVVVAGDGPDHLWCREYFLLERYRLVHFLPGLQLLRKLITGQPEVQSLDSKLRRVLYRLRQYTNRDIEGLYLEALAFHVGNTPSLKFSPGILSKSIRDKWDGKIDLTELLLGDTTDNFGRLVNCDFLIDGSFGVFTKFGKVAAEHSLLVREPYLDNPLVDFINRLPVKYKVGGSLWRRLNDIPEKKYLLRRDLAYKLLPQKTIYKRKAGFTPPMYRWMREYFKRMNINADILLGSSLKKAGFFDNAFVQKYVEELARESWRPRTHLYMLLLFTIWYRVYIENFNADGPSVNLTELLNNG